MALEKGQKAPDFTLKSKTAEGLDDIKLSNNFGNKNTVLLFFPIFGVNPFSFTILAIIGYS